MRNTGINQKLRFLIVLATYTSILWAGVQLKSGWERISYDVHTMTKLPTVHFTHYLSLDKRHKTYSKEKTQNLLINESFVMFPLEFPAFKKIVFGSQRIAL